MSQGIISPCQSQLEMKLACRTHIHKLAYYMELCGQNNSVSVEITHLGLVFPQINYITGLYHKLHTQRWKYSLRYLMLYLIHTRMLYNYFQSHFVV